MICRRVEELIPLYVEGDLASGMADRLASHLDWCGRCNWLADEYKESQRWLRTNEPPEFDAAFLDNFKAGVLRRIEKSSARQSLLASLIQQWSRRQVLALSAALLIIFGAVVFYVYRVTTRVKPAVFEAVQKTENPETPASQPPAPAPDTQPAPGAGLRRRDHPGNLTANKTRGSIATKQPVERPLLSEEAPVEQSGITPVESAAINDDVPGMLRIEIETGDPNVRIIWFAPREIEGP